MITEAELKAIEQGFVDDYLCDDHIDTVRFLIAEIRRLNAAYAALKTAFDPDNEASPARNLMAWRELVAAFDPETLMEWAKTHRLY